MKSPEQRTILDHVREWIMPAIGIFISAVIFEMRGDVKILLDSRAHQIEQIRALERATFGKVNKPDKDFSYNYNYKEPNQFIFDKTKTLQYLNKEFIYI
jgi:hypothetical protein